MGFWVGDWNNGVEGTHPVRLHLPPLLRGEFDKWNKPFYREGLKTVIK